jgi:all-trans-retinol 13,14-reductase
VYPNNDYDTTIKEYAKNPDAELPVAYISFPSAKNPAFEEEYPGKATIEIVSFAPWDWFAKWDGTRWHHRGEDYEALKEKITKRLLAPMYKHVPQVEGKIDFMELSTPLSTKHFSRYKQGEIYGLTHTPARFRQDILKPQSPIKGLYLSGQDVVTVGFGGAMMGGVLAAAAILKKNVLKNVLK